MMKLSIIMPVYNERHTIQSIVNRVLALETDIELVIVDDGSTDGTREILATLQDPRLKVVLHQENTGKGGAVRTGLDHCSGEAVVIQDADLEYDPEDLPALVRPIEEGRSHAVYGSRFLGRGEFLTSSYLANRFLTGLTNLLFGSRLTDMETCYKCMRRDVLTRLDITSKRFDMEPEITSKLLKRSYQIMERPIAYRGRAKEEGKKIGLRDGLQAVKTLFKYRFK
jgi:glycosyltransferase involved in cell wall biosynthesis